MATTLDNDSGLIEFVDPGVKAEPVIHMSGRFEYSRKYDRAVRSFNTSMGTVVAGMWLGGENKTEQQDAVFIAEDAENNLWMAVADGLGGHPGRRGLQPR